AGFPDGAINIAGVPNTDPPLPITVSSVNDVTNSEYYIDNFENIDICQDGFTVSLEASHLVTCGETYHIKLAIGDGTDTALESIVVLEAGSFTSNSVVDVDLSIDVGAPDTDLMYEDCGLATLTFTRPIETILEIEEMVLIEYNGTAENGIDYTLLPDTVIFPAGVQTVSFQVDAFEDGIVEGQETVIMEILNLAACNGGGLTSYFEFIIDDVPDVLVVEGYSVNMCAGDTLEITPEITGGYGNYGFDWSTGEDTQVISVAPDMTTTYNVMVSDTCGMPSDDADIEVVVLDFPDITVSIDNGDLLLDCFESVQVTGSATGGDGNFTYEWQDQNGNNLFGFQNSLFYSTWQGASEIHLIATDGCGFSETTFINVDLTVPPIEIDLPTTLDVDCNELFTLSPTITGGEQPYNFVAWYDEQGQFIDFQNDLTYSTGTTQTIEFQVTDNCGQNESAFVDIVVNAPPVEVTIPAYAEGTCVDPFDFTAEVLAGLPGYTYTWSLDGANIGNGESVNFTSMQSGVLEVLVTDACSSTGTATANINIVNPPVVVDLGEDIFAVCTDQVLIAPITAEGIGALDFSWEDTNAFISDDQEITYQTYENQIITLSVTDACGEIGTDAVQFTLLPTPITLTLTEDQTICNGDEVFLTALAEGGEGDLTIEWTNLNAFGTEQTVSPEFSQSYAVQVSDVCDNAANGSIFVEVQESFAIFEVDFITESEVAFFASEESQCA
ncbi:MAG: choice-of-anchor L domain-containing protein, partial [Bacteroidota bacterium]